MKPRLATRVLVSALLRQTTGLGGTGTVLARGDGDAGSILLWLADHGRFWSLYERRLIDGDDYRWAPAGPDNIQSLETVNNYVAGRRRIDPDLWVVELDIAGVERFAAQLTAMG